jgi:two-component system chemotaxis response regulator CheB
MLWKKHKKIRVLVVEDSPVAREALLHVLCSDPEIEVIGAVQDGEEAIAAVKQWKPDVVTMDIHMPRLNGYEATRTIMESCPVPIIVVSSYAARDEIATTFRAIEAGALMVLRKPAGPHHPDYQDLAEEMVTAIKLMSEVKVVRRNSRLRRAQPALVAAPAGRARQIQAVAIGASTGGPTVLLQILKALPADYPAPIFIVQHMANGFIEGLVEWLDRSCLLSVRLAAHGEVARPGCAYFAPDHHHLEIGIRGQMLLIGGRRADEFCPSVSHLFHSMAETYGALAAGILLTGMGEDGAAGLRMMREKGALTIAQDESSCAVFGMPKEAIRMCAAERVLSPENIPSILREAVGL